MGLVRRLKIAIVLLGFISFSNCCMPVFYHSFLVPGVTTYCHTGVVRAEGLLLSLQSSVFSTQLQFF